MLAARVVWLCFVTALDMAIVDWPVRRRPRGPVRLGGLLLALVSSAHAIVPPPPPPSCPLSMLELADGAPFLTHKAQSSPQPDLGNCSWYSDATCCTAEDALRISHSEPEIRLLGPTRGCRSALHMLMCAPCSPAQDAVFLQSEISGFPVSVLQTCASFCERLHKQCSSATLVLASGERDRVDALFPHRHGRGFCRAVGLHVVADDQPCFSAAGPRRGARAEAVGLLAAAAGTLLLLRGAGGRGAVSRR